VVNSPEGKELVHYFYQDGLNQKLTLPESKLFEVWNANGGHLHIIYITSPRT
jgi:hypothetical protein